jgi:hypothetical protein
MDPEELQKLASDLAALKDRAQSEDDAKAKAKSEEDERNTRASLSDKFGHLYSNDDDVGELVLQGLRSRGASVESATEEAVMEMLQPLADAVNKMAKSLSGAVKDVVDAVTEQADEVMNGPAQGEELALDTPTDMNAGAPPVDIPPAGMDGTGAPPPIDPSMAGMDPSGLGSPPPVDVGMNPAGTDPAAMAPPPGTVSDEDLKDVEPRSLEDIIGNLGGDQRKELLELLMADSGMLAGTTVSDSNLKTVQHADNCVLSASEDRALSRALADMRV